MAKKLINSLIKLGKGTLLKESWSVYFVGDTYKYLATDQDMNISGFVTGGSKTIRFTYDLDENIDSKVTQVRVNKLRVNIRKATGGYFISEYYVAEGHDLGSLATIYAKVVDSKRVSIYVGLNSGTWDYANNAMCIITVLEISLTFS